MKHRASLTFDKVIVDDKPVFRFKSCEGVLYKNELPKSYINGNLCFWKYDNNYAIESPFMYLEYGNDITPDEYQDLTVYLTRCGKHLTDILAVEAKTKAEFEARIRKTHNGTIVFKV